GDGTPALLINQEYCLEFLCQDNSLSLAAMKCGGELSDGGLVPDSTPVDPCTACDLGCPRAFAPGMCHLVIDSIRDVQGTDNLSEEVELSNPSKSNERTRIR